MSPEFFRSSYPNLLSSLLLCCFCLVLPLNFSPRFNDQLHFSNQFHESITHLSQPLTAICQFEFFVFVCLVVFCFSCIIEFSMVEHNHLFACLLRFFFLSLFNFDVINLNRKSDRQRQQKNRYQAGWEITKIVDNCR